MKNQLCLSSLAALILIFSPIPTDAAIYKLEAPPIIVNQVKVEAEPIRVSQVQNAPVPQEPQTDLQDLNWQETSYSDTLPAVNAEVVNETKPDQRTKAIDEELTRMAQEQAKEAPAEEKPEEISPSIRKQLEAAGEATDADMELETKQHAPRRMSEGNSRKPYLADKEGIRLLQKSDESVSNEVLPVEVEDYKDYWHYKNSTLAAHLQLMGGYRFDSFDWNIAGNSDGTNPNVLSELTWTDLESYQIKGKAGLVFFDRFVLDGSAAYSELYDGDNQDSDYLGDDRTFEFSRSNNKTDNGDIVDLSAALGYRFSLKNGADWVSDDLWFTPLAGYSYHELNLDITEGNQTFPASGPFPFLASEYDAEWKGPWLGFELSGTKKKWSGFFRFEYHIVDYYAEADWNLRTDFQHPKSFEHDSDGDGQIYSLGVGYALTDNFSLDLNVDFSDFTAEEGVDRVFFSNGTTSETRLNEVNWDSYAIMLGATYRFAH